MPRVSISIPEELMDRLEPFKDRIIVSQVCREALERRVTSCENAAQREDGDVDIEALIFRLREDRVLSEGRFEELGRQNAAAWLDAASYMDLRDVTQRGETSTMRKYRLPKAAFQTMKRDMGQARTDCEGVQADVYKTAWLDYVKSIRVEVLEKSNGANPAETPED